MKILLHGLNFSPEELGIGKYSGEMIEDLSAVGHQCVVVTTPPYYPQWRVWEGHRGSRYRRDDAQQTLTPHRKSDRMAPEVVRCPLWVPRKLSGLTRILHLASFGLSSSPVVLWKAFRFRPDVIMTVEPTSFCMPTTWLAARLSGAKAWLHVQDFEVDAAFDLEILRSKALRKLILRTESFFMRRFDKVTTISPNMVVRLLEKGVSKERSELFANWVDCNLMRPLWDPSIVVSEVGLASESVEPSTKSALPSSQVAACRVARRRFGIPEDGFIALYAGNIGNKQGLEILVDAARQLEGEADSKIHLVVCGNGSGHERLVELSQGLQNLTLLPVQPFDQFNELMNCADVHLLPQRAGAADLVMPSKLTGMLATGRPVIANAAPGTQIAKVVEGRGIVVPPGESAPLARAIIELASDAQRCQDLGETARDYAVRFLSREAIITKFRKSLQALAGGHAKVVADAADTSDPIVAPHFDVVDVGDRVSQ